MFTRSSLIMRKRGLTERMEIALEFFLYYFARHQRGPTVREVADAAGWRSTSPAAWGIASLVRRELVLRTGPGPENLAKVSRRYIPSPLAVMEAIPWESAATGFEFRETGSGRLQVAIFYA